MTSTTDVREIRLRKIAHGQGFALQKCCQRDPGGLDQVHFHLIPSTATGGQECTPEGVASEHGTSLNEIERFLLLDGVTVDATQKAAADMRDVLDRVRACLQQMHQTDADGRAPENVVELHPRGI
jgi:hypothetical protein